MVHAESFRASQIRGDEDECNYAIAFTDSGREL